MLVLLGGGFFGLYCSFLVSFGFVTHPLLYCVLLVGCSLSLSLGTFFLLGFSWYLVLFILVYVGGVYVLFLFVSVHSANSYPASGGFMFPFFLFYFFFFLFFVYVFSVSPFLLEGSRFLCSSVEGFGYLTLCFSLLVGFIGLSVVSSQKDSFFR